MEQKVKGCGSVDGLSSRPGAAERPEQRRWIRLTFAGRGLCLSSRVTREGCRIELSRVLRVVGRIRCSRPRRVMVRCS